MLCTPSSLCRDRFWCNDSDVDGRRELCARVRVHVCIMYCMRVYGGDGCRYWQRGFAADLGLSHCQQRFIDAEVRCETRGRRCQA